MKVTIYRTLTHDDKGDGVEEISITVEGDPVRETPEDVAAAYLQVVDKLSEEEK